MTTAAFDLDLALLPGESWWGGIVTHGARMPYAPGAAGDLRDLDGNQGMPFLLSNKGRYVWCDAPFAYTFSSDRLTAHAHDQQARFEVRAELGTLRETFQQAARAHFPPRGNTPDSLLFSAPQYNLWIEMLYAPTQTKVLAYADALLEHGFPPGVLMIDTMWHATYGTWAFDQGRFSNPRAMIDDLHGKGFKVMVWLVPYISPDTLAFRHLRAQNYLITQPDGKAAIGEWWDGYSAALDLLNPQAVNWLHERLDQLVSEYGVDGFKFDGGDPPFYAALGVQHPNNYCEAWNRVGLHYGLNEYRAAWKTAGLPLAQRIRDRFHSWDAEHGLQSLIPFGLAQGLMGYTYICPDMIGGGDYGAFPHTEENAPFLVGQPDAAYHFDAELFVRSAQCAALFPMMQFSAAPWRVLDVEHLEACVAAAQLHARLAPEILVLAQHAAETGEPIMRHLAYVYPHQGYEHIQDQFLLGDTILVAPVVEQGATTRKLVVPPGAWTGDDGSVVHGPAQVEIAAPLERLPWYRKQPVSEQ